MYKATWIKRANIPPLPPNDTVILRSEAGFCRVVCLTLEPDKPVLAQCYGGSIAIVQSRSQRGQCQLANGLGGYPVRSELAAI